MFILTQKKCSRCGEIKNRSEFGLDKRNKSGLESRCKACRAEVHREWHNKHKNNEEVKTKAVERARQWRANNRQKHRSYNQEWRASNFDKLRDYLRTWTKANRDKKVEAWQKRRARVSGNGGTITAQEWADLKKKYNYTCLCCERREPEIKLALDHVIPIALGGQNVISNAQPLCKSCNSRKSNKVIDYR